MDSDKIPKDLKMMIACSFGGLLFFILFFYAFTAQPVYHCRPDQEPLIAETVRSCLKEETNQAQIEANAEMQKKQLDLAKEQERNRHCEAMLSSGGKLCLAELQSLSLTKIKDKRNCALIAKEALCKPKMFLWKFWVLPGRG